MVQNPRSGKITKRLVDALTSEGVRFTLWDTQLKGFGVRVAVSDTKTYVVRYRTIGGADRLLHIARHGVVTAEEARERAAAVLAEVASGGDPQGTKVERREELTMGKQLLARTRPSQEREVGRALEFDVRHGPNGRFVPVMFTFFDARKARSLSYSGGGGV